MADGIYYTADHCWVKVDGDVATVGITDFAQQQLGDIVFVQLPEIGTTFKKGEDVGVVESVKVVSDIYAPVSGTIIEVNNNLSADPTLVNTDPRGSGWFYKSTLSNPSELVSLKKNIEPNLE